MDINTQRKIDRIAGKWICRMFSLFSGKRISIRFIPSKILVILLSEMGSLVLAKPMFDLVKERYPSSSLYGLCFERNREILEILNVILPGNILAIRDESFASLSLDTIRILAKVRKEKIDTVLDCELFSRISSIYSFLSGAKVRVGFDPHTQEGLYRGSFINRPVLYNPYHHISHQFINLVEAIESEYTPTVKREIENQAFEIPRISVTEEKKRAFLERLEKDFPRVKGKKLVLLYPSGGLLPVRAWPLENYCLVAEDFLKRGYALGIIGMKTDRGLAEKIKSYCQNENCVDLTGYTRSVRELMVLFHFASLLVTNDGGPGHFAFMTSLPSIVLYGPETPVLYGTLSKKSYRLHVPLSCSPCLTAYNHRNSPCDGDNRCLKAIAPGQVLEKAYALLESREQEI